jgi:signal transduction histidine kinase
MLEEARSTVPVLPQQLKGERLALHVMPLGMGSLVDGAQGGSLREPPRVVFELEDNSLLTTAQASRGRLAERLFLDLRSQLAAVDLAASMVANDAGWSADNPGLSRVIRQRVRSMVGRMSECEQYICAPTQWESEDRLPVNAASVLETAVLERREAAARKNVAIRIRKRRFGIYIVAPEEKLHLVFATLLDLLLKDATDGSTIGIRLREGASVVSLEFQNHGFGMPNEVFHEYLHREVAGRGEEIAALRKVCGWIENWGGSYQACSAVGEGIKVTLRFAKFL